MFSEFSRTFTATAVLRWFSGLKWLWAPDKDQLTLTAEEATLDSVDSLFYDERLARAGMTTIPW